MLESQSSGNAVIGKVGRSFVTPKDLIFSTGATIRGSLIGFLVGVLPGTGASVASAVAYTLEKRVSDTEGTFGKGDMRGLASPEAANNSCAVGAFVPMVTLAVPGSGTTAVRRPHPQSINLS